MLSIIIPCYNVSKTIIRTIESVLAQTNYDFEIIAVDDGSTDNTLEILKKIASKDNRIFVVHKPNGGVSSARNYGMKYAKGEYISFVDADDYVDNDFYTVLIQHIGDLDCVQIGYKRVSAQGKVLLEKLPKHFYQFTSPCMRLYRRELFTKHDLRFPSGMIYEDVVFSLDFWGTKPSYRILSYTGYNYLANTSSTTAMRNLVAKELLFATLKEKRQLSKSLIHKLLVIYTVLRLKFHFKRYD